MDLGLRSKNKKPNLVQVDYTIHIQEIRPWPPSQSLKSLRSVVLQWENCDRNSGSTAAVVPGQSKIEFNESFNLQATLRKEGPNKSSAFQKNVLELNLYEPRRDKGQLLGTAMVDLAEHGVVKEIASFGVPLNCKRSYRNSTQQVVYVKIQVRDKEGSGSSSRSRENLSKEASLDKDGRESVSSFMDDDAHENGSGEVKEIRMPENVGANLPSLNGTTVHHDSSFSHSLPLKSSINDVDRSSPKTKSVLSSKKSDISTTCYSAIHKGIEEEKGIAITKEGVERKDLDHKDHEKTVTYRHEETFVETPASTTVFDRYRESVDLVSTGQPEEFAGNRISQGSKDGPKKVATMHGAHNNFAGGISEAKGTGNILDEKIADAQVYSMETESSADSSHDNGSMASSDRLEHTPFVRQHKYLQNAMEKETNSDITTIQRPRFSMRSPPQYSPGNIRYASSDQYTEDVKEIDVMKDVSNDGKKSKTRGRMDNQHCINSSLDKINNGSRSIDNKVRELELRVEKLEGELREVAANEIAIYSIVAEHGSSVNKVHTPARRLSRLYIHASRQGSQERKASAARSIVSGLVLAAKACGNDVSRLAFWLSNSIVLRGIVTQVIGRADLPKVSDPRSALNRNKGKLSLKWESASWKKEMFSSNKEIDQWEDLYKFTAVLEKIEAWLFSRIVESIWWQILTPHMQPTNEAGEPMTRSLTKDKLGRKPSSSKKLQANLSIEIWNKALNDACGRLCPVRAEGHDCGCLPMLARLVMEQCVARLDVAMFNAILRESDDDIPTDPVSDPISDPKVLPIQPGKLSFGAGAQLKNAIGSWSRWLTDLFGMDVDDSLQSNSELGDERLDVAASFKSFYLLNAMSDLLMLPKEMLLEKSIRTEVCPTFTASMIRQILASFLPDEFCPDPIPDEVLEALDSEDPLGSNEEGIRDFPCNASPVIYKPPAASSIAGIIGGFQSAFPAMRSESSVIRKCHASDDELDELDSPPLASILRDESSPPGAKGKRDSNVNAVRYLLLRDLWRSHH